MLLMDSDEIWWQVGCVIRTKCLYVGEDLNPDVDTRLSKVILHH